MFEFQILFGNIIAPGLLFAAALVVCTRFVGSQQVALRPAVMVVSAALAIQLAYALRNGWSIWPEDAWQRIPIASLLIALVAANTEYFLHAVSAEVPNACESETSSVLRKPAISTGQIVVWLVRAAAVLIASVVIFPSGESWSELQTARTWWLSLITLSVSVSWFVAYLTARLARNAQTVAPKSPLPVIGLSLIPWTVAAAILISQSFMKVTEPMLAVATMIGLSSIFDWLRPLSKSLPAMIGPLHFASAAAIAHGQFYSFLDLPTSLYTLAIVAPAIIVIAALVSQFKSVRAAQIAAPAASIAITAWIVYHSLA